MGVPFLSDKFQVEIYKARIRPEPDDTRPSRAAAMKAHQREARLLRYQAGDNALPRFETFNFQLATAFYGINGGSSLFSFIFSFTASPVRA
jgi:hypothetical protein